MLDPATLPDDPRAAVLVTAAGAVAASLSTSPVGPDEIVVAPGAAAAGWLAACGLEPAAVQADGPFGCLLGADGVLVAAGPLGDALRRDAARRLPGAPWHPVAVADALLEAGLSPRVLAVGPSPDPAPPTPADLAAVARRVPVMRGLRAVTGRYWPRPVVTVTVGAEAVTDADLVAVVDRWLSSSVEDVAVVVPRWLPEYDADPRVAVAGRDTAPAAPFTLQWPATLLPHLRTGAGLLDIALRRGCSLVRVRTPGRDEVPLLTRSAVVARLIRGGVTHPGVEDFERLGGTWWADGVHLGLTPTAERPGGPVAWARLDQPGWQRIRELEAEVARLRDAAGPGVGARRRRSWRRRGRG